MLGRIELLLRGHFEWHPDVHAQVAPQHESEFVAPEQDHELGVRVRLDEMRVGLEQHGSECPNLSREVDGLAAFGDEHGGESGLRVVRARGRGERGCA